LALGSRVLDVGAGTGAVATLAADAAGATGVVVALDPAIKMLRVIKKRCRAHLVVGELPRLPHRDGSFDAIAASFVLTHVDDPAAAIAAMTKALRPGGRLALSSWAQTESTSPPGRTWQTVATEFVHDAELQAALHEALPSQDEFMNPTFLAIALKSAGLLRVRVRSISYSVEMAVPAFAELRNISAAGRYIASVLRAPDWTRFKKEAARRLSAGYGSRLRFEVRANIAVGSKAG
jgi:ubiquinone/menaquinone biosynthesis C-methylase UbiE